jgi:hypothetical protein
VGLAITEWRIVVCTEGLERVKQEVIALNGIIAVMQSRVVYSVKGRKQESKMLFK